MKFWSSVLILALISNLSIANTEDVATKTVSAPTFNAKDTLAKRHPFLATASLFAMRHLFGQHLINQGTTDLAPDMMNMIDFSLALVAPDALKDNLSDLEKAGALLIISALPTHTNQIKSRTQKKTIPLNPIIYSGTLTHLSGEINSHIKPYVATYINQTMVDHHSNSFASFATAASQGIPALGYYLVKGDFKGLTGALALGAAYKTVYILFDGFEKLNTEDLRTIVGDKSWVEPVAQLETGFVLAVSSKSLEALSVAVTGLAKKVTLDATAGKAMIASGYAGSLANLVPAANRAFVGGLLGTLASLAGEVAGYEFAAAGFTYVEKKVPEQAAYINPVLATVLINYLTAPKMRTWLKTTQPAPVQAAATGAALAGFLQIFSAVLNVHSHWEDDISAMFKEVFYAR